jgi:hypothetical protein
MGFARFILAVYWFGQLLRGKDHERREGRYLYSLRHIRSVTFFAEAKIASAIVGQESITTGLRHEEVLPQSCRTTLKSDVLI